MKSPFDVLSPIFIIHLDLYTLGVSTSYVTSSWYVCNTVLVMKLVMYLLASVYNGTCKLTSLLSPSYSQLPLFQRHNLSRIINNNIYLAACICM